ncbi:peptidoglycan-binding protein [Streptomyces sp. TRM49041]|uniref:efflux RND transporter periplasmic adaptor subunit n=1 Tax=Streptomyces sp. TRM49041 TaxID=2603216 RepID=UPI0021CD115B|nr:peptidoglycan-binding protein [Streptomyces sp. TRM49041]
MSRELMVSGPADERSTARSGLSRRRRWVAAIAVGAALAAAAGVGASTVVKSPAQAAAEAGPPPADVLTAAVERRVLRDTVILRGRVTAGQTVSVTPAVSGGEGATRPVVTKLAVKSGDVVSAGKVLLEVSGRPVFVLEGGLPVYRDLKPGAEGEDVAQLQKALSALGHSTGSDTSGRFGAGTKAALKAFYASIGYDALPAQADGGAAVKAAEEMVTSSQRALEDAQDALRAASAGATEEDGGKASGGASDQDLRKAVTRAEADLAKAREALASAQAANGPMLPAGEVVFLKAFPARVDTVTAGVGSPVSGPVLTISAGALVIEGHLQQHQKGMVRPGQKVQILSELSGITSTAKVHTVADSIDTGQVRAGGQDASGEGGGPAGRQGYLVVVQPDKPLDAKLAGQDVRLTIEAASTDGDALVVPITAISAGADGKTTVTVVTDAGAQQRVEVRPGTTGDGYVEIVPVDSGSLSEGDAVVTGVDARIAR